jgi:hypothetical protein
MPNVIFIRYPIRQSRNVEKQFERLCGYKCSLDCYPFNGILLNVIFRETSTQKKYF